MELCIPHSIFHLVRLLYVRQETFGPYYVLPLQLHFDRWQVKKKTYYFDTKTHGFLLKKTLEDGTNRLFRNVGM